MRIAIQLHFTLALPIFYYDEQGDGIMLKVSKCAPSFLPFLPSSTWKLAKSIFLPLLLRTIFGKVD